MSKLLLRTIGCLVFFGACLQAAAQDQRKLVSANFNNVDITVLTRELEQQTGFYFYYDVVQFDSARFNLSVTNETLQKTLEAAFQNTDFRFAILETQKQVFLTKGVEIKTDLPAGFFGSNARDTSGSAIPDYGDKKAAR